MHSIHFTTLAILSLFLPGVIFRCDGMKKMRFEWYLKIKLNTKQNQTIEMVLYI